MAYPAETILKTEPGYVLRQKGDKTHTFNPPLGTLILTDRRLIFAQSSVGIGKRLAASSLGIIVGNEALRVMSKVNPEDLNAIFKMPESFFVNLADIAEAKVGRRLGAAFLAITSNAPGVTRAEWYRQGTMAGISLPQSWVDEINAAKQRLMVPQSPPMPPLTPPPYGVPGQPAPPQPAPGARGVFCMYCGASMPETDSFCPTCGKKQE